MNITSFSDFNAMTTEQLRDINSAVVGILKYRQQQKINDVKDQIRVGSKVKINHFKAGNTVYTITEIRRKRATVKDQYGYSLNVPIALVELYQAK
jgi:hypothetical protein